MAMSDPAAKAIADALWEKALEDFAVEAPHQAFIKHCQAANMLDDAAKRYREHKESLRQDDPAREQCDKRLSAIAILAVAAIEAMKSTPTDGKRGLKILTLFVAIMTIAAVVGLIRALLI